MTIRDPSSRVPPATLATPGRLVRMSLWMVAVFVAVYFLTSFIGLYLVFPMLGLKEGDIALFARSVGGWATALIGWLLLAAAPVTGVALAVRAQRRGARASAWIALTLNSLIALLVAYMIFDEIRMTYFPQFTFPFSG